MSAASQRRFTGGVRWRGFNATWPLASLVVSTEGFSIEPSAPVLRFLRVPTLRFRWSEVEAIQPVQGLLPPWRLNRGIRFLTRHGAAIFWCGPRFREVFSEVH